MTKDLKSGKLEDSFASKSSIPRRLPHTPVERNDGAFIADAGNCMVIVDAFGQYSLRVRHGLHRVSGIQVCIALSIDYHNYSNNNNNSRRKKREKKKKKIL